ncbi:MULTISPECIES: hypothetical protein [Luteimonas]|uniref:Secreted protein n=1 Tax=Luteimonas chenhongjianii TaxID=2006110 RepID=A0A290XGX2_9GAMM|nr:MULTISPECIES: hypothetical protein [Luteimonas]ATD68380.1 hypothetical protein CNR27_13845 [Luteimonas chenhongjianii]RPD87935.1 hypothetical protein EGK76_01735 [Luteimonas sp. 100069]
MCKWMLPVLLAFLPLGPVSANVTANDAVALDKGVDLGRSFEAQRQAILQALADGEVYKEISPEDMQIVRDSLARMSGLLGDVQDVGRLPELTRVEIFNEQGRVNALLTRAHADSRLVCRREKPVGSNRSINRCMTVAERNRERDNAQDLMRNQKKSEELINVR